MGDNCKEINDDCKKDNNEAFKNRALLDSYSWFSLNSYLRPLVWTHF